MRLPRLGDLDLDFFGDFDLDLNKDFTHFSLKLSDIKPRETGLLLGERERDRDLERRVFDLDLFFSFFDFDLARRAFFAFSFS